MAEIVTPTLLRDWPLPRPGAGKHSRGDTLVVGGSPTTPGAAMLAGLSALRVGAGVLALAVARSVAGAVAVAVPEAAVVPVPVLDAPSPGGGLGTLPERVQGADAVLLGPGLDEPGVTRVLLRAVVAALGDDATVVADAFTLGVLTDCVDVSLPEGRAVLTPNRAEAARLLPDADVDELPVEQLAVEVARRHGAIVSLNSTIATADGDVWTVPSGHPGLGTSGSGDVLAGAVTGLLARGAEPAQAACWGTFLHATAGDRLAARIGRLGFLARELADELTTVLTETEA